MDIKEIQCNIFDSSYDMIVQQVNCKGAMGAGLALQIKQKFPEIYNQYRDDFKKGNLNLGYTGFYRTNNGKWIACMCAQEDYGIAKKQTNEIAFQVCLNSILKFAYNYGIENISFPGYIGCGLAGGNWNQIKGIIINTFKEDKIYSKNIKNINICYL